jgi:hypothetical protein
MNFADQVQALLLNSINLSKHPKVVGQALGVSSLFLCMLQEQYDFQGEYTKLVTPFYDAITAKLNESKLDTEVRNTCIISASDLISVCHKVLS